MLETQKLLRGGLEMSVLLAKGLWSTRRQPEAHSGMQRQFRQEDSHEHGVHGEKEPAAELGVKSVEAAVSKRWLRDSHFRGEAPRLGDGTEQKEGRAGSFFSGTPQLANRSIINLKKVGKYPLLCVPGFSGWVPGKLDRPPPRIGWEFWDCSH